MDHAIHETHYQLRIRKALHNSLNGQTVAVFGGIKMENIKESLVTPVRYQCDVLVVGGGVAGIAAALAAARNGAKVMLVEKQYILGGLATAGLVTIYLPLCDGMGNQVTYGIAEELLRLSIQNGYEAEYPAPWLEVGRESERTDVRFRVRYNAQLFAIQAEQLLLDNGVFILYGTSVCNVVKNEDRIDTVIIENKSGRAAVRVASVIDCSGDGDVCALAGEDTSLFAPGNILAAWHYYVAENGYDLNMLGVAEIPEEDRTEETVPLIARRFQGVDEQELSRMVQLSHKRILEEVIQKQKKGYYMPVTIATIPQIRMTRRINGLYTLGTDDGFKTFSDSVGLFGNWKKRGPVYQLPFRSLIGGKVHNLITAGRNLSATDAMWDVTRVIPVCVLSGQAAGTAAAMCRDFQNIDVKLLQKKLQEDGVRLWYDQIPGLGVNMIV